MVVKFVKTGASPRQAVMHVKSVWEEAVMAKYKGCSEGLVARFTFVVIVVNL